MRTRLLAARRQFVAGPQFAAARAALAEHLATLLAQLEPERLGVYWPIRGEFDAAGALAADPRCAGLALALPYAETAAKRAAHRAGPLATERMPSRPPVAMHYRAWSGAAPTERDGCGIPTGDGVPTEPDVVLIPCVGHTPAGHRLGYGGGYFDRWLAAHPAVTAIGIDWLHAGIDAPEFIAAPHDRPLMLIVTERGVA